MARVNYLRARDENLTVKNHPPVAAATIPVLDGLVYASLFSGGVDWAAKNWAPAGADGIVVGTPEEPDRYVNLPAGCYVNTGLPETLAATVFAIGKAPTSGFSALVFLGSSAASGSAGIVLSAFNATSAAATFETTGANAGMTIAANINQWGMYAASSPADGNGKKLYNLTAGTETTSANALARAITGTETMRIGATYNSGASGSVDELAALYFNRALSPSEIAALALWGREYAADFGITV